MVRRAALAVLATVVLPGADNDTVTPPMAPAPQEKVNWRGVWSQSGRFLAVQHGFRLATEPGTRDGFRGSYFRGYLTALRNLHGWSDGDPAYVNYVGHPMQGAVAGYIWLQNDPAYRAVPFDWKSRRYWVGRLRSTGWSALYSEQFEIGPLSEASIGQIQARPPQQGFVDHVVTPTIGLGWMVAEDAVDALLAKLERRIIVNPWARLLLRGSLNPSRSMANMMAGKVPWHRDTRLGIVTREIKYTEDRRPAGPMSNGPAPFEFSITAHNVSFKGGADGCLGGGGVGAYRVNPSLQMVLDVAGCRISSLGRNVSGDSISYFLGPRWTPLAHRKFSPHLHLMVGGNKMTQEWVDPVRMELEKAAARRDNRRDPPESLYTTREETHKFAFTTGGGVDWRLKPGLAWRIGTVEYTHTWGSRLGGVDYSNGLRLTTGLVVRMGTW